MTVYANEETAAFRKTLDRLPDEIALAIGLRVYDEESLGDFHTCVCGWIVREAMASELGIDAESVSDVQTSTNNPERFFGGSHDEWREIFRGVCEDDRAPLIEEALFDRVMAAVENTSPARRPSPKSRRLGQQGGRR